MFKFGSSGKKKIFRFNYLDCCIKHSPSKKNPPIGRSDNYTSFFVLFKFFKHFFFEEKIFSLTFSHDPCFSSSFFGLLSVNKHMLNILLFIPGVECKRLIFTVKKKKEKQTHKIHSGCYHHG